MLSVPDAYLSHQLSGRMRIKMPQKKGDSAYFLSLNAKMSKISGIERLEANPVTGSVLFIHNIDVNSIFEYARKNNLFDIKKDSNSNPNFHKGILEAFKGFNSQIKSFTGGEIDLWSLSFILLVAVGLYQISMWNFAAPAWYTAFWYALNIFLKSGPEKGIE
ncbi:MAG: HMA2 domain-containing protein [Nitrospirota bacterium]